MGVLIVHEFLHLESLYFLEHKDTGAKHCEPGNDKVTLFRSKRHVAAYMRRKRLDSQKWDVVECNLATDFEKVGSKA